MESLDRRRGTVFMIAFTMAGDLDAAYATANHIVDEYEKIGNVGVNWAALWTVEMRPFRDDPRFHALVRRIKLLDYWKVQGPPDDCTLDAEQVLCGGNRAALERSRGSLRPTAWPTRTVAAIEMPNGTMNTIAAICSAI